MSSILLNQANELSWMWWASSFSTTKSLILSLRKTLPKSKPFEVSASGLGFTPRKVSSKLNSGSSLKNTLWIFVRKIFPDSVIGFSSSWICKVNWKSFFQSLSAYPFSGTNGSSRNIFKPSKSFLSRFKTIMFGAITKKFFERELSVSYSLWK